MKNKISLIAALVFVLAIFPFNATTIVNATTPAFANQSVSIAQEAAQNWLEETASINPELSQWQNAKATTPQPYENLEGVVNAYMFEVIGEKGLIGHILVGSSLYCYDILEAGTAPPPVIPEPSVVQKAIEALGLTIDETTINKPDKYIYTGVDGCYALYTIKDQKVAVNLVFENAVLASDLKMSMTSPQDYLEGKKETRVSKPASTRSIEFNWLYAYYWNGPERSWCGPCSGVSIGAYYRNYMDYGDLYDYEDMYDDLYDEMHTGDLIEGVTLPGWYGPGFIAMTENCGYDNFSYANDWIVTHNDYWTVVSGIDAGHPTALLITLGEWHWRVIKAYGYNVRDDYYHILCTNSQTEEDWENLNWDALGFTYLFTCRIMD